MTENEAIEVLKRPCLCDYDFSRTIESCDISSCDRRESARMAISALEEKIERNKFFNFDSQAVDADYKELEQYRALGTVEELWEAMERQRANKPEYRYLKSLANCPTCGEPNLQVINEYGKVVENYSHCPDCGQAIDWSKEE